MMPKTLVLVRHAKTETALPHQRDFDRELKQKGRVQAKELSLLLQREHTIPDYILSSPAVRAQQTAALLAQHIGLNKERIFSNSTLYNAAPEILEAVLQEACFPEDADTLLLVAHNPGISEFAMQCAPGLLIDYLPPCGMVLLTADIGFWADFTPQACHLLSMNYPKTK